MQEFNFFSSACIHFEDLGALNCTNQVEGLNQVFTLNGEMALTKKDLLEQIASCLSFPDYFGMNWDALDECLMDLSWLDYKGYVLVVRNALVFWQQNTINAGKLVSAWQSAAEIWSRGGVPFHLVFVME